MSKKGSKLAPYTIRYNEISNLNLDSLDVYERFMAVWCQFSRREENGNFFVDFEQLPSWRQTANCSKTLYQYIVYHLDGHLDVVTEDVTCPDDHDDCSVSMLLSQSGAPHITSALLRVPPPTERRHSGRYSCRGRGLSPPTLHQHSTNHSLWQEYQINILL